MAFDNKKEVHITGMLTEEWCKCAIKSKNSEGTEDYESTYSLFSKRVNNIMWKYHTILSYVKIPELSDEDRTRVAQLINEHDEFPRAVEELHIYADRKGWLDLSKYLEKLDVIQRYKLLEELKD